MSLILTRCTTIFFLRQTKPNSANINTECNISGGSYSGPGSNGKEVVPTHTKKFHHRIKLSVTIFVGYYHAADDGVSSRAHRQGVIISDW